MDDKLRNQLVYALIRLRRTKLMATYTDIDLTALFVMKSLANNRPEADGNIHLHELQDVLHISKAAVSQIAGNLAKKGYLLREISKENRRKLTITLTPEGREAMQKAEAEFDKMLSEFFVRLGENDSKEMVRLFSRFADIAEELHSSEAG
jgi:DNA-binding MarR family transcriptional regulator